MLDAAAGPCRAHRLRLLRAGDDPLRARELQGFRFRAAAHPGAACSYAMQEQALGLAPSRRRARGNCTISSTTGTAWSRLWLATRRSCSAGTAAIAPRCSANPSARLPARAANGSRRRDRGPRWARRHTYRIAERGHIGRPTRAARRPRSNTSAGISAAGYAMACWVLALCRRAPA